MDNMARTFALSLATSLALVWLYFGLDPLASATLPAPEGSVLNGLMKIVAIPLTLLIVVGGGLAACAALDDVADAAGRVAQVRKIALCAPAGIVWIVFMATLVVPLGALGNVLVVGASLYAIVRIAQNVMSASAIRKADAGLAVLPASPKA
jgi:hypothetical protein